MNAKTINIAIASVLIILGGLILYQQLSGN